jgi:hypothetical protein
LKTGNLGEIRNPFQRFFRRRDGRTCAKLSAKGSVLVDAKVTPALWRQKELGAG